MLAAFKMFDKDGSGHVTLMEFAYGLQQLGIVLNKKELLTLWLTLDEDASGLIDYSEFSRFLFDFSSDRFKKVRLQQDGDTELEMMQAVVNSKISLSKELSQIIDKLESVSGDKPLNQAFDTWFSIFKSFDNDGDGKLDQEELRQGLQKMQVGLDETLLIRLWSELDAQDSGRVEFDELATFLVAQLQLRKDTKLKEKLNSGHVKVKAVNALSHKQSTTSEDAPLLEQMQHHIVQLQRTTQAILDMQQKSWHLLKGQGGEHLKEKKGHRKSESVKLEPAAEQRGHMKKAQQANDGKILESGNDSLLQKAQRIMTPNRKKSTKHAKRKSKMDNLEAWVVAPKTVDHATNGILQQHWFETGWETLHPQIQELFELRGY